MTKRTQLALTLLFASPLLQAEMNPNTPVLSPELVTRLRTEAPPSRDIYRPKRLWKTSLAIMAAASAADLISSIGKRERNPMLAGPDGRFGARGIAVKSAFTGGALLSQFFLVRKSPQAANYAAFANFGMTGLFTSVTLHNLGNSKVTSRPAALR